MRVGVRTSTVEVGDSTRTRRVSWGYTTERLMYIELTFIFIVTHATDNFNAQCLDSITQ